MAGYDTYLLSVNPNAGNPLGEEKGLMAGYDTYLLYQLILIPVILLVKNKGLMTG